MSQVNLPKANLVFLIDVSGSMDQPDKLPLVQASLRLLVEELRDEDKVAIVVYAGNAGLVLPSTPGSKKARIKKAIDELEAGGSTAGEAGIKMAYKIAKEQFIPGGNNRVILATDGDFNVGVSSDEELVRLIEKQRETGIFLSVLGYGTGNYQDGKMQQLADKGNGNHSYIDNINEARKVLVSEFGGTLFTIAKDVKVQVAFNPAQVKAYRLIGYENRMLATEDFEDDQKDAGELGSGHTVTALYEIIPAGIADEFTSTDPAQHTKQQEQLNFGKDQLMTIHLRYKEPQGSKSKLQVHSVNDQIVSLSNASENFRFSAAVASFGMLLKGSRFRQGSSYDRVLELARSASGKDANGYRAEFIELAKTSKTLAGK
jgi:Ca-activated chloride channel family protein